MENKKEPIKIKLSTVIVLLIILILIVGMIGIFFYYNSNKERNISNTNSMNETNNQIVNENTIQNSNKEEEKKIEELDINSEIVKKLYNYILKDNECIETIAYQSKKVTIDNLENKAKLMTIFENMNDSEASTTKQEKLDYGEETYYFFSKSQIEEKAKQIFGNKVSIKHETLPNLLAREIVYENGEYRKSFVRGGGGFLWEDSTEKLVKAEKTNDEIYLYDKYIHVVRDEEDYNNSNIYNSSDRAELLMANVKNASIDIDKISNVNIFKHTFKKNSDGSYYWYSTEPIEGGIL